MPLRDTDSVSNGASYQFDFVSDGFFVTTDASLTDRVVSSGLPVRLVSVNRGWFSSITQVRFTWASGGWTVRQVYQNIERVLSEGLGNFTFASGSLLQSPSLFGGGITLPPAGNDANTSLADRILGSVTGISFSTLLWGAGALLLIYFISIYALQTRARK
jgi:hypothetical protein